MALDWKTVRAEHIKEACDLVASGGSSPRAAAKGIFVVSGTKRLPAKHVLRLAYCIANRLPLSTYVDFSSGEDSVRLLRGLGFEVDYLKRVRAKS